jgi:UDP-4-amino-4,6-dideoxy-N-acetyl-beta-L-altrosamine transaminase
MKDEPKIPYGRQWITDSDIEAVVECLKSDFLTQGPAVARFERAFSDVIQAKYASAVMNGTVALHLAARALGVEKGTRVLTTPNTFVASANCIRYCGGEVEFVDIDPSTFCMDLDRLEEKLRQSPKGHYAGVVVVDFAGFPVDLERLRSIADQNDLWIIEDACHALGAAFRGRGGDWIPCGGNGLADATVFSFHPVKHITTGEGGMVTTARKDIHEKVQLLRSHGITRDPQKLGRADGGWYYEMIEEGYNYRLPDILCALGLSQLGRLKENLERRRRIAEIYREKLRGLPMTFQADGADINNAYHLFVIQSEERADLYKFLHEEGILVQVHYIPVHQQPYYIHRYGPQRLPVADRYYERALSLPMYHRLDDEQVETVVAAIRKFYGS